MAGTIGVPCTDVRVVSEGFNKSASSSTMMVPLLEVAVCEAGTECVEDEDDEFMKKCLPTEPNGESCTSSQWWYDIWESQQDVQNCQTFPWRPECDPEDGSYEEVQAKVNAFNPLSRKFCSDPTGLRIFGSAGYKDEEIACQCSRKHWELAKDKMAKEPRLIEFLNKYDVNLDSTLG